MKHIDNNGFIGTDILIALIAIIAFSGIIFSLIYHNAFENVKIKKSALASIYLTEIMENISIQDYENITQENIQEGNINLLPTDMDNDKYTVTIEVNPIELPEQQNAEDIAKKIKVTISYTVQNKTYQYSMERIKIRE